jgi:hypothetical protein
MKEGRGSVVVKALCYKPDGRRFETRCRELIFTIYVILLATLGPEDYSVPNRNYYQKQKNKVLGEYSAQPMRKADNLTTVCEPIVYIMWDS